MAKNSQPVAKRCKALNVSPTAMGYAKKNTNRNPKGGMRRKPSEYALQLNEKQKVKFVYGVLEKQFSSYYEKASKMPGKAGDNLLILCERRLDNVVYHRGFAQTRRQARQLVSHAHFTVDGKNLPAVRRVQRLPPGLGVHDAQAFMGQYRAPATPDAAPVRTAMTDPAAHFQGFPAQDVRLLLHIENANYSTHNS